MLSPQNITVAPGGELVFAAVALDESGRPIAGANFDWRVKDPGVGVEDSKGLFSAGLETGAFPDSIEVEATAGGGSASSTASLIITDEPELDERVLQTLVVYPPQINVRAGQIIGLGAVGWDESGRFVQALDFRWTMAEARAGKVDQFGFFTTALAAGDYPDAIEVTATQGEGEAAVSKRVFVSVTISDQVRPGVLDLVVVIPGKVTLNAGQRVRFIARAFDEVGRRADGVSYDWQVSDPAAGDLEGPGSFVAGSEPGEHSNAVRVKATQLTSEGLVMAEATVAVTVKAKTPTSPHVLASVRVLPMEVTLSPGQLFIFSARGLDADGVQVPVQAVWKVASQEAGSFDASPVFTAGSQPGTYKDAVVVELTQNQLVAEKTLTGFATVKIVGPLVRVEISPRTVTVRAGESVRFKAVGFDASGLRVTAVRLSWGLEDQSAGTINVVGIFTAGPNPGRYDDVIIVTAEEQAFS